LDSHASGRRSGDQFCVYVCDRLIVPALTRNQIEQIGQGRLFLDRLTRDLIRAKMTFRFIVADDGTNALAVEKLIKAQGLPVAGRPMLKPGSAIRLMGAGGQCKEWRMSA